MLSHRLRTIRPFHAQLHLGEGIPLSYVVAAATTMRSKKHIQVSAVFVTSLAKALFRQGRTSGPIPIRRELTISLAVLAFTWCGTAFELTYGQGPEFVEPVQITTQGVLWGAAITGSGLELYVSEYNNDQWEINRITRPSIDDEWPDSIGERMEVFSSGSQEDEISFTSDGLTAVFNRQTSLYQSSRETMDDEWTNPTPLGISGWAPSLSADGLTVYYTRDMWNNSGADIYVAKRDSLDDSFEWSAPLTSVNTPGYRESSPHISEDGLSLFFVSNRPGGEGLEDIWLASRRSSDSPFDEAINLGPDINTNDTEWSPFTTSKGDLYYTRDAQRGVCCWHIWYAELVPSMEVLGDFNFNGKLDPQDVELLELAIASADTGFDLTGDNITTHEDTRFWIETLKSTYIGDSNLDGEFNSSDMVKVFFAGRYEREQAAGWAQGDWDGSGFFDSSDMVTAFVDGGYETGLRTDAMAVPEPAGWLMLILGVVSLLSLRRR